MRLWLRRCRLIGRVVIGGRRSGRRQIPRLDAPAEANAVLIAGKAVLVAATAAVGKGHTGVTLGVVEPQRPRLLTGTRLDGQAADHLAIVARHRALVLASTASFRAAGQLTGVPAGEAVPISLAAAVDEGQTLPLLLTVVPAANVRKTGPRVEGQATVLGHWAYLLWWLGNDSRR